LELVLPFSSDPILREQYISPFGHVRLGRLLEDLDAFAGNVAFHHAFPSRPTIVTASVNKLDLIPKSIDPTKDLRISGGVTSVGSSSMEIRIDAFQGDGWPLILTTYFTMVARGEM
jgi:acyl-coenzyme A thioesterase 9